VLLKVSRSITMRELYENRLSGMRFVHVLGAFSPRLTGMLGIAQGQGAALKNTVDGTEEAHDYLSYLLRLWREGGEKAEWRASLEDPHTGEQTGFASVEALFAFLRQGIDLKEEE
jgi:hypothetical protein